MNEESGISTSHDGKIEQSISASAETENDDELTPLVRPERDPQKLVSANRTLMNFLRAMIGPGCLSLPQAFKYSGLWTGFGLMFVVGYLNTHCMSLLVNSAQFLCEKSGKVELDYGHLAKKVFDFGPVSWRSHSKRALYTVNFIIVFYQIGVCSVQLVFMAANMQDIIKDYYPATYLTDKAFVSMLLPMVVAVCFVRHLKTLSFFATFGNILMLVGFVIIFQQLLHPPNQFLALPAFTSWQSLIMSLGAMLYAIEGQATILPLENKMSHPEEMRGMAGVLNTGMTLVTCIYAATGFFGYGKYGANVEATVTLNMPKTWLFNLIKGILIVSVYMGVSLQFYVIIEMLWPAIRRKLTVPSKFFLPLEYVFRLIIVLVAYGVAMIIPHLDLIIPLVGITAGSILAFVLPGLFDMVTFWEVRWQKKWKAYLYIAKNVFLIGLGIFALVIGLYSNIRAISSRIES